jgi:hypothetical protein
MTTELLSHAIKEVERHRLPTPAVAKALAVMRALKYLLDSPRPADAQQGLTDLDVSALVDEQGWPQIRYTLAPKGGQS